MYKAGVKHSCMEIKVLFVQFTFITNLVITLVI